MPLITPPGPMNKPPKLRTPPGPGNLPPAGRGPLSPPGRPLMPPRGPITPPGPKNLPPGHGPISPPGPGNRPPATPDYVQQFQSGLKSPQEQQMFQSLQKNIGGNWGAMARNVQKGGAPGMTPLQALQAKFKNAMAGLQGAGGSGAPPMTVVDSGHGGPNDPYIPGPTGMIPNPNYKKPLDALQNSRY